MAYFYLAPNQSFTLFDRADTVRETQYGVGAQELIYPNVSTCTTVTLLLNDDSLLGAHFAKRDPAATVDAILARMNTVRAGRAVQQMFVMGVLRERDTESWMGEPRYGWPSQLNTFNSAFGRNAGALVQGFVQNGGDQHYRVRATGNGAALAYAKAGSQALDAGTWNALTLTTL